MHDDTDAFKAALSAASYGDVILVPAGRYVLSNQLVVEKSGVVIQGDGSGLTTLFFSRSLTQIFGQSWLGISPESTQGIKISDWQNGPGLIRFAGPESNKAQPGRVAINVFDPVSDQTLITAITSSTLRGAVRITTVDSSTLFVGQMITIALSDVDRSLINSLYGYIPVPRQCMQDCVNQRRKMRFHSKIFAILADGSVVLERPLPFDVNPSMLAEVHAFNPGIVESGIEDLTIEMRWEAYAGHLKEAGWSGVEFAGASNCWLRNLVILNTDTGIMIWKSSFVTATGIVTDTTQPRAAPYVFRGTEALSLNCHHAVNVSESQDVHVKNVAVNAPCIHDLSSYGWNNGVVFSNTSGYDLCLDLHALFPFSTLFSDIDLGYGYRGFVNNGLPSWGMQSGAYTTYWSIRASRRASEGGVIGMRNPSYELPSIFNGPFSNFVGIQWGLSPKLPPTGVSNQQWLIGSNIEPERGVTMWPIDLADAMINTRGSRFIALGREIMAAAGKR